MFDYLTATAVDWRSSDHKSTKLVKTVKGKSFEGYLETNIKGHKRRFTHPNCEEVVNQIAWNMAAQISDLIVSRISLVPIPNSHVVARDEDYRCLAFARKITDHLPHASGVVRAFHWKVARDPQHQQKGQRHMSQFVPNLMMARTPKHPVILVDDMLTSGSQMLACTYLLRKSGCEVLFGMSVGRAVEQQNKQPIEWRSETYTQDPTAKR